MSDLRDRIAAAMLRIFDEDRTLSVDMGAFIVADAVIAELGLREERTETEALTNEQGATWFRQGGYRHVTDWKADDE